MSTRVGAASTDRNTDCLLIITTTNHNNHTSSIKMMLASGNIFAKIREKQRFVLFVSTFTIRFIFVFCFCFIKVDYLVQSGNICVKSGTVKCWRKVILQIFRVLQNRHLIHTKMKLLVISRRSPKQFKC